MVRKFAKTDCIFEQYIWKFEKFLKLFLRWYRFAKNLSKTTRAMKLWIISSFFQRQTLFAKKILFLKHTIRLIQALTCFKLFHRRNWFVKCCIHQARHMGYDTLSFSIFSITEIGSRKKNMRALQAVKSWESSILLIDWNGSQKFLVSQANYSRLKIWKKIQFVL